MERITVFEDGDCIMRTADLLLAAGLVCAAFGAGLFPFVMIGLIGSSSSVVDGSTPRRILTILKLYRID